MSGHGGGLELVQDERIGNVSPFYPRMWNCSKFVDVLGVILHVLPGLWRGVVSGFMDAITAPPKPPPGTFPAGF